MEKSFNVKLDELKTVKGRLLLMRRRSATFEEEEIEISKNQKMAFDPLFNKDLLSQNKTHENINQAVDIKAMKLL